MELQGTIKLITDIQTFPSGFQKREMVLMTQEQYPQPINIEFLSEKASILDTYKVGDDVKVGINLRGREWTSPQGDTKYFNSIIGWRVEKLASTSDFNEPTQAVASGTPAPQANANPFADEEDDDLPF